MRVERFTFEQFGGPLVEGAARRSFIPPSLVPEAAKAPEAPPPPPTFSEQELKAAEQDGYRKGFLEGTKEGKMQAEGEQSRLNEALNSAVGLLTTQLGDMISVYNTFVSEQKAAMPPLALAIAEKVAGKALAENPLPLIEGIVTECISKVLGEPHIVVTVHPSLAAELENRLVAHFSSSNAPGEIDIHGSETLGLTDCQIAWGSGSAARSTDALWEEINQIIQNLVFGGKPKPAHVDANPDEATPAAEASPETTEQAADVPPAPPATETPSEPQGV